MKNNHLCQMNLWRAVKLLRFKNSLKIHFYKIYKKFKFKKNHKTCFELKWSFSISN